MYPSVEDVTQRHREVLARARQQGQAARLRALRRAARRAKRAAKRLDQARTEARQIRSKLDVMS
jgi:hypothetical protein